MFWGRWTRLAPLLAGFAVARLLLQALITEASVHAGYGIYRDELYYLVCGRRLAAGYVDQPPLVALQARLSETLFGFHNLALFRLLPNLAGAVMVVLTGLIADALGGSRRAVTLAMLSILSVPVFLATQSFLSMNAWDPVFWMAMVLAALRLVGEPERRTWWVLLGVGAGLGIENKASAVFLIAALLFSLLTTPARRLFRHRGFLLAVGITIVLATPNLVWQCTHGFPTWEWLHDVQHANKVVVLPLPRFLLAQVLMLSPLDLVLWLPGVLWLLFARAARPWRFAGVLYATFFAIMIALHAKDYYVAPIYPLCFAAGAVFWTNWAAERRLRRIAVAWYVAASTLAVVLTAPFAVPVLSPADFVRYTHILHFNDIESEQHAPTPLPEFFADQLGWQELADDTSRIYHALPVAEQKQTGIMAGNYGQASAITVLGAPLGLPPAISGHQNYWLWGPRGYTGKEMIVISADSLRSLERIYHSCTLEQRETSPYAMPWEQRSIFLCHDRLKPYATSWNSVKLYF